MSSRIAHDGVAEIAAEARDAAEAGHEPEAQLREGEARALVGDDHVGRERQLEAPAEAEPVNRSDGRHGRGIEGVEHRVDAIEEVADFCLCPRFARGGGHAAPEEAGVELAQVGAGAEALRLGAVEDHRPCTARAFAHEGRHALELGEGHGADLVAGRAVQRHLEGCAAQLVVQRLARKARRRGPSGRRGCRHRRVEAHARASCFGASR